MEKALAAFAAWALDECSNGYDVDGADLQKKAVELNIATIVPYDAEVHGTDIDADPGDDIYVLSDEVKALL